jgi:hypothetical protein
MAATWNLIETKELTSNTSSFTFSSIPGTYTDLRLMWSGRTTYTGDTRAGIAFQFNSTTSGYRSNSVYGFDGANPTTQSGTSGPNSNINSNSPTDSIAATQLFGAHQIIIPNYADAYEKTIFLHFDSPNNVTNYVRGFDVLSSTLATAITSITVSAAFNNLKTNSIFSLYGIKRN